MRSAILGFCSVARNSSRCSAQVRSVKCPSCQAAIEGGRVSYLNHEERKPECWCRAPRASGCVTLPFGALLRANFLHGLIYEGLQLLRVGIGVAGLDVLYGAMKHAPADGSSMNFERSPFFMPRVPRKVRRVRSVSFETLMFQRTASSIWSPMLLGR